jgi:hypothetical protein
MDGDAAFPDGAGIYVNHVAVADYQIRRDPVHRRIDHTAQNPFVHVFHVEISFRGGVLRQSSAGCFAFRI